MLKKQRRIHDNKYLDWIRGCPCIVCLIESKGLMNTADNISEPHHVSIKNCGAMGSKTDDSRTIPLCHKHHMLAHSIGRDTFEKTYGLDYEYLIKKFNRIYKEKEDLSEICS